MLPLEGQASMVIVDNYAKIFEFHFMQKIALVPSKKKHLHLFCICAVNLTGSIKQLLAQMIEVMLYQVTKATYKINLSFTCINYSLLGPLV